ncbi:hypothetical protein [Streptomyces sp. NRRL S-475]|uniref:hypothetical protein n=1 Tax=Streptomyces sp. NRRL S-475 TaxID=1463910 RepID=UPI0004BD2997|nr:hypothetical protein [Streptomyces sp. NRRL S-475]
MDESQRIDVTMFLWVETSTDGRTWAHSQRVPKAEEYGRDCRELRAIVNTYVRMVENIGPRFNPVSPWFRVVVQGTESGTVLAVVPRKWNAELRQYESTGGEWLITDHPKAYHAWCLNLIRSRVLARL